MNVLFLDDSRERIKEFRSRVPSATIVETAGECIAQLNEAWDIVFLDHDLGGEVFVDTKEENTGSGVVRWIVKNNPSVGRFICHSLNFDAAKYMVIDLTRAGYDAIAIPFIYLDEHYDNLLCE